MTGNFFQVLFGSFILSGIHALIPNHWIPLVAIAKTEKWTRNETLAVTAIAGSAHTASTILIGIIVGIVGYRLSSTYEFVTHIVAPIILIGLGCVYLIIDVKGSLGHQHLKINNTGSGRSKLAIISSLGMAMFFSPCIEIEAYYFVASALGWLGIVTVSVIYLVITVFGMVILVTLGLKGIEKLEWNYLEYHEKRVTGLVLVFLGILAFFFRM